MEDGEVRSASRDPLEGEAALSVLDGIDSLWVAKGKKVVEVDLGDARPADDELLGFLLGRSGKLRAPTVRKGSTLLVGFHQERLSELVG